MRNYGTLTETIERYLYDRKDLRGNIPDWIEMAERRIYRNLRVPAMEQVLYIPELADNEVEIPRDFIEAKIVLYDGQVLQRVSDQEYLMLRKNSGHSGRVDRFARVARSLVLWRHPQGPAEFTMIYYEDSSGQMGNPDDTSELLRMAPDLYIYGACLEAMPYLGQDERIAVWQDRYDRAWAAVREQAHRAEYAGSTVEQNPVYSDERLYPHGRDYW